MSDSLIERTAKAMYREDPAVRSRVDWGSLSPVDHTRYMRMAKAALAVGLREPVGREELVTL